MLPMLHPPHVQRFKSRKSLINFVCTNVPTSVTIGYRGSIDGAFSGIVRFPVDSNKDSSINVKTHDSYFTSYASFLKLGVLKII